MHILNWFRDKRQASTASPADKWPLSMPLVRFSRLPADMWTLADSFQGVAIFGENGSGKTSGSGRVLARASGVGARRPKISSSRSGGATGSGHQEPAL